MYELSRKRFAAKCSKSGLQIQIGTHFGTPRLFVQLSNEVTIMRRTKFQNPGNGTLNRSALSVFSEMLRQNGACELFAMEHFCAASFLYVCLAPQFAFSPARFLFLATRLPCCVAFPLAAAIAIALNLKSAAAA